MRKTIIALSLASGLAASPAFAQEKAPFEGVRVEGLAGYDEGFVYGGAVGYDLRAGGVVIGIEGEATDSTAEDCLDSALLPGDRLCALQGRDLFGGLRIGVPIGDKALIYAKGGYTNTRLIIDYDDGTAGGLGDSRVGDNFSGARVAGGIEFSLGGRAYIKGEYRYSNYEDGLDKHDGVAGIGIRF